MRDALKTTRLAVSMAAHAAILAAFLGRPQSSPQLIAISIATIPRSELRTLESDAGSKSIRSEAKRQSDEVRHLDKPSRSIEKPARGSVASPVRSHSISSEAKPLGNKQYLPDTQTHQNKQRYPEGQITVSGGTDWQDSLVEDNKLTYSGRGTGVRLTVREASSAGFVGTNFSDGETSALFGQVPIERPIHSAISQRLDWTVVESKNFAVTVFGYQNQVGSGFKPFGETKTEFSIPGTRVTKFGGQVRAGALGLGFAQSAASVENPAEGFGANYSAAQSEASVTLALSKLVPDMEPSLSKLLPTSLWASFGDKGILDMGPQSESNNTAITSFGGAWKWDSGYTNLSYWSYSSGKNPGLGAAWNGQGFDANLGTSWSALGLNLGLSYGRSEDATASWQSAGALYFSSATVSYKPDRFPAMWVTAGWGNYHHNEMANTGTVSDLGTLSDLYAFSTQGAYTGLTAGLDLSKWLQTHQTVQANSLAGPSVVKLIYRYTENDVSGGSARIKKHSDSLVALMTQAKF